MFRAEGHHFRCQVYCVWCSYCPCNCIGVPVECQHLRTRPGWRQPSSWLCLAVWGASLQEDQVDRLGPFWSICRVAYACRFCRWWFENIWESHMSILLQKSYELISYDFMVFICLYMSLYSASRSLSSLDVSSRSWVRWAPNCSGTCSGLVDALVSGSGESL